ncbi:hypothetical protein LZ31DRAFT_275519 [Colletotrichum somersetense]|nr:hypothetical protein LZ31DRAFT_275519 [Colletotrichum somersetense]
MHNTARLIGRGQKGRGKKVLVLVFFLSFSACVVLVFYVRPPPASGLFSSCRARLSHVQPAVDLLVRPCVGTLGAIVFWISSSSSSSAFFLFTCCFRCVSSGFSLRPSARLLGFGASLLGILMEGKCNT